MDISPQQSIFSEHNTAVVSYLDFFLGQDSPQFAVLLTGPWGCGKTWFIEQYLCNRSPTELTLKFSVAGCKNTSELNARYISAKIKSDPKIRAWYEKLSSNRLGQLIERYASRRLLGKDEATLIGDAIASTPNVIIIDDVERTELDTKEIIGFVNYFVEDEGVHTILVANEEKLLASNTDFDELKEKIVGQTLSVFPELSSAITSFHAKVQPAHLSEEDIQECSGAVFRQLTPNLRALKQALYDFKRLQRSQSDILKGGDEDEDVYSWLFLEVLIYRVALNTHIFDRTDLYALCQQAATMWAVNRHQAAVSEDEKQALERLKISRNKVDNFVQNCFGHVSPSYRYFNFLSPEFVVEFFCDGVIDSARFEQCIRSSRFFQPTDPPWWSLSKYLYAEDDEEFESRYDALWRDLETMQPLHPGDFLHVVGIFLTISSNGYGKSEADILRCSNAYIQSAGWTIDQLEDVIDSWGRINDWNNRQFQSIDTTAFQMISDQMIDKQRQLKCDKVNDRVVNLPEQIKELGMVALSEFYYSTHNHENTEFYATPVLTNLDVAPFVEAMLSLEPKEQLTAFGFLSKRYTTHEYTTQSLKSELKIVMSIQDCLAENMRSSSTPPLVRIRIQYILNHYVEPAIAKLESVQDETSST